jgi:pentatricopeptide repeat protein
VNYCSVLKGFSHQKQFDRVWAVYKEMIARGLEPQFTSVTYNTLIDACARCGEVHRTPAILEQMHKQGIEPNLVTYSVCLKGLCQDNQLDKAFELMESMKQSKDARPDELAYNTLLDGCARQGLYQRGMQVFATMEEESIAPSNFTLSILVKLANRGRKLEKAFELSRELPEKHGFRINLHVYNNLIQGCIMHKDLDRAVATLACMFKDGVRPDSRTYTLLIQGHVNSGEALAAVGLLRAATGLPGATHQRIESFCGAGGIAKLRGAQLPSELFSEVIQSCCRRHREESVAADLVQELRTVPGLQLDAKLVHRVVESSPK